MKRQVIDLFISCILLSALGTFFLYSCSDKENFVVFTRPEVIRLLSNDSSKSWERKMVYNDGQQGNMTDCDLNTHTQFISKNDRLIYIIRSQKDFCGGNSTQLDSGLWDVLEESIISDRIDRIGYYSYDGDTIVKEIREITALFLTTEYNSGGILMQESFQSRLPD